MKKGKKQLIFCCSHRMTATFQEPYSSHQSALTQHSQVLAFACPFDWADWHSYDTYVTYTCPNTQNITPNAEACVSSTVTAAVWLQHDRFDVNEVHLYFISSSPRRCRSSRPAVPSSPYRQRRARRALSSAGSKPTALTSPHLRAKSSLNSSHLASPLYSRCRARAPCTPLAVPHTAAAQLPGEEAAVRMHSQWPAERGLATPGKFEKQFFLREKVFQSPDTTSLSVSKPCSWAQRCPADVPIAAAIHTITPGVALAARTLPTSDFAS